MRSERRWTRIWIVALLHTLAGLAFLNPGYIRPDSVGVYAYLRSLVIDGDLLFLNEWAGFGMITSGAPFFKEITELGTLANHWWVGTSLLSSPFYLVAHLLSFPLRNDQDGFSSLYALTLSWTTVGFSVVISLICEDLLSHLTSISGKARWTLIAALWLGTPLFWYEFRFPLGSHLAGALCVAVLCRALLEDSTLPGDHTAAAIGLALGLASATRIQHVVLGGAILIYALRLRRPMRFHLLVAAGTIPGLAVQGAAWWVIYGTPLGPLVSGANSGGSTWMPFHTIAIWPVLVSSYHGLLSWSPIAGLSILGLLTALFWRKERIGGDQRGAAGATHALHEEAYQGRNREAVVLALGAMLAFEWIANGVGDRYFWGGMSFGARRFVDAAVPLAVGLGFFRQHFNKLFTTVTISLCVLWSLSLTASALAGKLELALDLTPGQLLRAGFNPDLQGLYEALSRPVTDTPLSFLFMTAFLIVAAVLGLLALLVRNLVWATRLASALCLGAVMVIMIAFSPTRARARQDLQRFRIDRRLAARFGPLTDQRGLLQKEVIYYENRGQRNRAQSTLAEIEVIDRLLRELRHSSPPKTKQQSR